MGEIAGGTTAPFHTIELEARVVDHFTKYDEILVDGKRWGILDIDRTHSKLLLVELPEWR